MINKSKTWHKSTGRRASALKRILLVLSILTIVFGLIMLAVDHHVAGRGSAKVIDFDQLSEEQPYDCVIVPGALVLDTGRPSSMLRARLDMAIRIYRSGVTDRILVSGDHGQAGYNEVGVMRTYLMEAGIPEEHIFMDHAGFDTYNTIHRAMSVFSVERALITTQDFHLLRALYIGGELGLDLQGIDSGFGYSTGGRYYRLREYPARFKAFLECRVFKPSPVFGGPIIPIDGDGRATLD